jgi:hypothetical protein
MNLVTMKHELERTRRMIRELAERIEKSDTRIKHLEDLHPRRLGPQPGNRPDVRIEWPEGFPDKIA